MWSTESEMKFIKGFGTHRQGAPKDITKVDKRIRLNLLKLYQFSIEKRVQWGNINPHKIANFVDDLIIKLESNYSRQ